MSRQLWFTSDWHLDHKNIIKYDNRPFKSIHEMNETIISNTNKVVKTSDILYYLGDFAFSKSFDRIQHLRNQINCDTICFILGNHDKFIRQQSNYLINCCIFDEIEDIKEISFGQSKADKITLCHYAMRTWNKSHHGTYHLYGHSHHNLPEDDSLSFDVGVNGHNYYPVSLDDVICKMSNKNKKKEQKI